MPQGQTRRGGKDSAPYPTIVDADPFGEDMPK